jgi:hypothetical protein
MTSYEIVTIGIALGILLDALWTLISSWFARW